MSLPAEPACWSWPPDRPAPRVRDEKWSELVKALGLDDDDRYPPCFAPPTPEVLDAEALVAWHDGRCAICGRVVGHDLVEDHDHATGLIRGYLCRSCNVREARGGGVFELYRRRPPVTILGVTLRYVHPITRQPDMGRSR